MKRAGQLHSFSWTIMPFAEDTPCLMAVIFSMDGLICSLSSSVEQLMGYPAEDLIGQPITRILDEGTTIEVPHMIESVREKGAWEGDITCYCRNGKSLNGRGSLSLLRDRANSNANDAGLLLLSILNKATPFDPPAIMEMGDMGIRLRMLAHELNNPLAVMMGFTQLIMLDENCNGKIRSDMEKVFAEMQRLIEGVERLYSYAVGLQNMYRRSMAVNE